MRRISFITCLMLLALNLQISPGYSHKENVISAIMSKTQKITGLFHSGKNKQAIKLLEETIQLTEEKYGKQNIITARLLNKMAVILIKYHEHKKAKALLKTALLNTSGNNSKDKARALNNLAIISLTKQDFKNAENLLSEALTVDHDIHTLLNLAYFYQFIGRYHKSATFIEEAQKKTKSQLHQSTWTTSGISTLNGNYYLREAHDITSENNKPDIKTDPGNYTEVEQHINKKNFSEAEKTAKTILNHITSDKNSTPTDHIKALGILADIYIASDRQTEAITTIQKVIALEISRINMLSKNKSGKKHLSLSQIHTGIRLIDLAKIYTAKNQLKQATPLLEQAHRIFSKTLPSDHPYIRLLVFELRNKR